MRMNSSILFIDWNLWLKFIYTEIYCSQSGFSAVVGLFFVINFFSWKFLLFQFFRNYRDFLKLHYIERPHIFTTAQSIRFFCFFGKFPPSMKTNFDLLCEYLFYILARTMAFNLFLI